MSDKLVEHYFRFILAEQSGTVRERLQRGLVALGLKTASRDHAMRAADIQKRIEQSAGLLNYPPALIARGLNELISRSEVVDAGRAKGGERLYRLSRSHFKRLERAVSESQAEDDRFRASVERRFEQRYGKLDRDSQEAVGAAFATFVGQMLASLGERCANQLVHERSGEKLSYPAIDDDIKRAVRGLPEKIQGIATEVFEQALRSPTAEEKGYLYAAGQVYYVAELLHIDPELQALQRERFSKTVVFLDTNLLLALLLETDERHEAVSNMVNMCGKAGFTLVYAERTAEELDDLITGADREYQKSPPIDLQAAASFAGALENPILQAWLESYSDHRSHWSQFRAMIGAWRALLEKQGVNIHLLDRVSGGDDYNQELMKALGEPRKTKGGELRQRRQRAIEHDAAVVTGVRKLASKDRTEAHPFGGRFWFITLDRRLVGISRESKRGTSVCMLADEWVQYVSPFVSADVTRLNSAEAFAGLLSSRFIPQLGKGLTLDELRTFTEPKVAELAKDLPRDEACRAVADAHQQAVRRDGTLDDEKAVERLAAIAEKAHKRLRQASEGGQVRELKELKRAREAHDSSSSRDRNKIKALEAELAEVQSDQRSSVAYMWRTMCTGARRWVERFRAWLRGHSVRATVLALIVVAVIALEVLGLGGLVGRIIGIVFLILGIIALDPDQARSNLSRVLGTTKD